VTAFPLPNSSLALSENIQAILKILMGVLNWVILYVWRYQRKAALSQFLSIMKTGCSSSSEIPFTQNSGNLHTLIYQRILIFDQGSNIRLV